jgi:molybdopterin-guanine dinucleotide biosynthesis protein A
VRLSHVEGAVLAGGASSRMGRDKARIEWRGELLAARVVRALAACVERVRIVLRPEAESPLALERIDDVRAERAPIVGLEAALAACEASALLVAACDLPEIEPRLLLALLALCPAEGGPDAIVPCGPKGPEPLLAIYRPRILPALRTRIERGELSLQRLVESIDALLVPERDLRVFDPDLASLRNVNRPEDLA